MLQRCPPTAMSYRTPALSENNKKCRRYNKPPANSQSWTLIKTIRVLSFMRLQIVFFFFGRHIKWMDLYQNRYLILIRRGFIHFYFRSLLSHLSIIIDVCNHKHNCTEVVDYFEPLIIELEFSIRRRLK